MKRVEIKTTRAESNSFNGFAEERVMAFKAMKPKPNMSPEQEDHLRACFFNCIVDSYFAGMQTKDRKSKPEALGLRQLTKEIKDALRNEGENKKQFVKYLKSLGDRVKVLTKVYSKSKSKK